VLGPLVIGVCCIPDGAADLLLAQGVKDSKHLSPKKRQALETWFNEQPTEDGWFGTTVSIQPETIDHALQNQGLNWLEVDGFREAILELPQRSDMHIVADACDVNAERFTKRITDGLSGWPWKGSSMISEHKADERHAVVSMASILAKEERDRAMRAMSKRIGFNLGSGYPADPATKASLDRLVLQSGIDEEVRWGWATIERYWRKNRSGDVPVRGVPRTKQQLLFQKDASRIS
tara:strand:+ start:424 stop:1125 length:702 start_codon:yes stop_codon:yes gene_type:complete